MRPRSSVGAAALSFALVFVALGVALGADAQSKPAAGSARIERGKYLVTILACNDCHTPWKQVADGRVEPDMTRMLSGHPEGLKMPPAPPPSGPWIASIGATFTTFSGPFGTTYAINLTPDENTGIGIWTEEMFVKAMRTGKHMGTSRAIQPPMPWMWYSKATDEDLKSIYAYLRTVPKIVNRVPDYEEPMAPLAAKPWTANRATPAGPMQREP